MTRGSEQARYQAKKYVKSEPLTSHQIVTVTAKQMPRIDEAQRLTARCGRVGTAEVEGASSDCECPDVGAVSCHGNLHEKRVVHRVEYAEDDPKFVHVSEDVANFFFSSRRRHTR